uniref:Putative ovule protein n=1 Tax=Solanum chacoense TaxID=4108 RepID=A0A0V0GIM8_SOLCH
MNFRIMDCVYSIHYIVVHCSSFDFGFLGYELKFIFALSTVMKFSWNVEQHFLLHIIELEVKLNSHY